MRIGEIVETLIQLRNEYRLTFEEDEAVWGRRQEPVYAQQRAGGPRLQRAVPDPVSA